MDDSSSSSRLVKRMGDGWRWSTREGGDGVMQKDYSVAAGLGCE